MCGCVHACRKKEKTNNNNKNELTLMNDENNVTADIRKVLLITTFKTMLKIMTVNRNVLIRSREVEGKEK